MFDSYKDLKRGDFVKFEEVYIHDRLKISGIGEVIGFGEQGYHIFVWVETEEGARSIPYEKTVKL